MTIIISSVRINLKFMKKKNFLSHTKNTTYFDVFLLLKLHSVINIDYYNRWGDNKYTSRISKSTW